ncbi:MAG: CRTAC1 family protein, partial [bacterium]|nr:CRTAC1 family protein [bacterium]
MRKGRFEIIASVCAAVFVFVLPAYAGFTRGEQFGDGYYPHVLAWGDYDGDGYLDVAEGCCSDTTYVYHSNGDNTFTRLLGLFPGCTYENTCMAWADFDNDGDLDIAVGGFNEYGYFQTNNGDGTFTQGDPIDGSNTSLGWADYDLDGDIDLVTSEHTYVNNGDGTFDEIDLLPLYRTMALAWGDYDNDGDPDLVGGYRLYINNGDGTFTVDTPFGVIGAYAVAWGDYDNDADLDLAAGCLGDDEADYLFTNNGDGTFTEVYRFGGSDTLSLSWGDSDNNGYLDIAVGNVYGNNYLYLNSSGTFTEYSEFGTCGSGMAWGDSDNDGDIDLAKGGHYIGGSYLYINDENSDDFLSVKLVGQYHDRGNGYSNRDGIGAKVLVYEQGYLGDNDHLLGFREIGSKGGWCGQDSIEAEFGLAGNDYVDIKVIWPGSAGSHIEDTHEDIAKGQFLVVREGLPLGIDDEDPNTPTGFALYQSYPNPASGTATIGFALPETADVKLDIYDIKGR